MSRAIAQPNSRFDCVTTKMVDFKPFKIQPTNGKAKRKEVALTPSFPGQYQSTTKKDFGLKVPLKSCDNQAVPQPPSFSKSAAYFNPLEKLYYV